MPVTVIWASEDVYSGLGQREALQSLKFKNSAQVIKYAEQLRIALSNINAKVAPLLSKRTDLAKDGQDLQGVLNELVCLEARTKEYKTVIEN